jgi:Leucine Rich repeat
MATAAAATAATTITRIPAWLQEICRRLDHQDESLTHLNLNIRRLNDDGTMMRALASAVCQSPHLLVLNLTSSLVVNNNHNSDRNEALEELVRHVIPHHNSSLQVLHVSYNHLRNVMTLGQALQTNQNLIELHLSYNCITAESATFIAQGIQVNQTLQVLILNCNEIGDAGAVQIAKALKNSSSSSSMNRLRRLGLERNGIHQTGAAALQDALTTNFTLYECSVSKNEGVSTAQLSTISTMCRANKAGRGLLLVGCPVRVETATNPQQQREGGGGRVLSAGRGASTTAILPLILARARDDPNVLLSLLTSCADMLTTTPAVVVGAAGADSPCPRPEYRQQEGAFSSNKRAKIAK